jgi:bifunctional non-homologous end joining protein LigD
MHGDGKRENWLLIKKNDEEARRNSNGDFLESLAFSVKSGRRMEEIAGAKPRSK